MQTSPTTQHSKITRFKQLAKRIFNSPHRLPRTEHSTVATELHSAYLALDDELIEQLPKLSPTTPPEVALEQVRDALHLTMGFDFFEIDETRPWGGFFRIVPDQTDKFLAEFFPGISEEEARFGHDAEISPKIMLFLPGQRISWQYHHRRTERWHFLTDGEYYRSTDDHLPASTHAQRGDVVQFRLGERHRGGAPKDAYVLVAEIWQHTDPQHPSDEADVVRLEDDYDRPKHPSQPSA